MHRRFWLWPPGAANMLFIFIYSVYRRFWFGCLFCAQEVLILGAQSTDSMVAIFYTVLCTEGSDFGLVLLVWWPIFNLYTIDPLINCQSYLNLCYVGLFFVNVFVVLGWEQSVHQLDGRYDRGRMWATRGQQHGNPVHPVQGYPQLQHGQGKMVVHCCLELQLEQRTKIKVIFLQSIYFWLL